MKMYDDDYDDSEWDRDEDMPDFAEPGSNSALRAATPTNPRDQPCPTCAWPNRLTREDVRRGYQCNPCANAMERGIDINHYEDR
jgi:hypothetical protein